jgi:hypothetical protein
MGTISHIVFLLPLKGGTIMFLLKAARVHIPVVAVGGFAVFSVNTVFNGDVC